ncbi:MAG: hypothetical protein NZ518_03855, partial [Dehalococcoidia bacterium]|nr:hypothetical protein [Dehalococcoidia bacterium]
FMIMWLEMGLPEYAYKMMVRSFLTVFPESTLWYNGNVIVGSKQPIRIDRRTIAAKFSIPGVKESLASIGFRDVNDVLREYVAGPDELREYVGPGPVLTDRHPAVEYFRTLPASGQAPDLRWRTVARFVHAREAPDDGILFGSATVADLFGYFHPRGPAEYIAPVAVAGREAELEATLAEIVAKHPRIWFIPAWTYEADIFIENWLDKHAYKVIDQPLGNLRAMLYVSVANEPTMRPFAVNYADTLLLSGVGVDRTSVAVGEVVRFRVRIDALDDLDEAYKVLIKLVDANGRVMATRDYTPRTPTTIGWRERTNVLNRVGLLVPAGTPPGAYTVELAMYHVATGQPLKPLNPNARGDRVIVGQLTVTPPTRTFLPEAVAADVLPGWMIGNAVRVAGYTLDSATRRPGDLAPVTIYWQGVTGRPAGPAQVVIGDPANPVGARRTEAGGALPPGAVAREDLAVRIRPGTAPGRYDVWLTHPHGPARLMGTVWVAPGATLPTPAPPAQLLNATVGDVATLVGGSVRRLADGIDVQLVWRGEREIEQNYFVFVQILSGGAPIAQSDQAPAKGLAPTTAWVPGQLIGDQHTLAIRAIPPDATLIVGLFDPVTFERVPIGDRDYATLALP